MVNERVPSASQMNVLESGAESCVVENCPAQMLVETIQR